MGNVLFGLNLKPGLNASERLEVARYYLKLVELERFTHSNIHELSGGMKQRVALARALAPNPRVLLMDEPFGALDALTREQLYGDIQRIWEARRKTIVFVTHNVREAACLGDRVILFSPNPGRIRQEFSVSLGRPRDINSVELAQYSTEITAALKGFSRRERRQPNEARRHRRGILPAPDPSLGGRRADRLVFARSHAISRASRRIFVAVRQQMAPSGPPRSSPCAGCLSAI